MRKNMNYWTMPSLIDVKGHNAQSLINRVALSNGITSDTMKSGSRLAAVVQPRNIAMFIMRVHYGFTYKTIGDMFGKTHCTVINGVNTIRGYMEFDKELTDKVNGLI